MSEAMKLDAALEAAIEHVRSANFWDEEEILVQIPDHQREKFDLAVQDLVERFALDEERAQQVVLESFLLMHQRELDEAIAAHQRK
jgi:hypothetical protein